MDLSTIILRDPLTLGLMRFAARVLARSLQGLPFVDMFGVTYSDLVRTQEPKGTGLKKVCHFE